MQEAPELDPWLSLYWQAYGDLSTCRPPTWSELAPIPWNIINEYATVNEFDDDQRERLHRFVGKMDDVMSKWHKKKYGNK